MAEFGLSESTTGTIRRILAGVPAVSKAVIYGSRAKGNYRPGSDIDLTLFGAGLDLDMLGHISTRLDESPIPYQVATSPFLTSLITPNCASISSVWASCFMSAEMLAKIGKLL